MKIIEIKTYWPENPGFQLERQDTGEEFIFIHLLTAAYLSSDSGTALCPAGSCICYRPHSYQYLETQEGEYLVHDWAHIAGDFCSAAAAYGFALNTVYQVHDDPLITGLFHAAELETLHRRAYADDVCALKLAELMIQILRESAGSRQPKLDPGLYSALTAARLAIHLDYSRPWRVSDMAALAHLSPSRFYALYKSVFGVTPKADLHAIRLEHAKMLLAENRRPVREIAQSVGYANEYYFIRAFKQATGRTPGKYKQLL